MVSSAGFAALLGLARGSEVLEQPLRIPFGDGHHRAGGWPDHAVRLKPERHLQDHGAPTLSAIEDAIAQIGFDRRGLRPGCCDVGA
jgi:hypothetical protein